MKVQRDSESGGVPILIRLDQAAATDFRTVGGKFQGLARLHALGFPVPPAWVIPAAVVDLLPSGDDATSPELDRIAAEAATKLNLELGIAVRSSGLDEDMSDRSAAGRYETVLDVRNIPALREAISKVLVSYRERSTSFPKEGPGFAIILQQMVTPTVAGVAFSRHPLRATEDLVVVEAVEGLADRLVSGRMQPVQAILGADPSAYAPLRSPAGEILVDTTLLSEIRDAVRSVEKGWGGAVDVEWAVEAGHLLLLQARPATAMVAERPDGVWSRGIAEDLWGDEMCALDASILRTLASRFDLRGYVSALGIPIDPVEPVIDVIEGYLYVNVRLVAGAFRALPKGWDLSILSKVFPPDSMPPQEGRALPIILRGICLTLRNAQANPFFCPYVTRRRCRKILANLKTRPTQSPDLPSFSSHLEHLVDLEGALLATNQMPYFYAFALTWLIENRYRKEGRTWEGGEILKGCRTNPTFRMNVRLRHLGDVLRREAPGVGDAGDLPAPAAAALKDFLEEFGARTDTRSLAGPRWAEIPTKVMERANAVAAKPPPADPGNGQARGTIFLRLLIRLAKDYLELREELRDTLDRILWEQRKTLLRIGHETGLGEKVFDLALDQVLSITRNESTAKGPVLPLPTQRGIGRKGEHFPPRFYIDRKAVERQPGESRWEGVPTSGGRVHGLARQVRDLDDAMVLEPGAIVVAQSMGPSWTSILSRVSGVVLAEGSMLNHFSIVAREYHIPCVVGVGGEILQVPDGTVIGLDGYEGIVWIVP